MPAPDFIALLPDNITFTTHVDDVGYIYHVTLFGCGEQLRIPHIGRTTPTLLLAVDCPVTVVVPTHHYAVTFLPFTPPAHRYLI